MSVERAHKFCGRRCKLLSDNASKVEGVLKEKKKSLEQLQITMQQKMCPGVTDLASARSLGTCSSSSRKLPKTSEGLAWVNFKERVRPSGHSNTSYIIASLHGDHSIELSRVLQTKTLHVQSICSTKCKRRANPIRGAHAKRASLQAGLLA